MERSARSDPMVLSVLPGNFGTSLLRVKRAALSFVILLIFWIFVSYIWERLLSVHDSSVPSFGSWLGAQLLSGVIFALLAAATEYWGRMRNDRYELAISPDRITHTLKGNSESILRSEVRKVAEVKNWRNARTNHSGALRYFLHSKYRPRLRRHQHPSLGMGSRNV